MGTALSAVKMLYDYNRWANERVLVACEQLTLEQWSRKLDLSWGSIHDLLTHMFAAEVIWLSRWKGDSPRTLHQPVEFPTFHDLERAWVQVELEIQQYIDSLTDKDLTGDLTYTNTKGEISTFPLGSVLLHVANHSTHHRGELAAMLTLLAVQHPEDDLLLYLREKNHTHKTAAK
jgi:uncharacterized damage-inducible protein DinB